MSWCETATRKVDGLSVDPVVFFKLHLIAFFDSKTATKSGLPFTLRIRRRRKIFFEQKEAAA